MAAGFWNIVIPSITGIIGILTGSLKPIIDWKLESRKFRRDERKTFISDLRKTRRFLGK
jgi:hypothetical protein